MRTIILILFLALPAFPQMLQGIVGGKAPAAVGGPVLVQSKRCQGTDAATCTLDANATAGNALIVITSSDKSTPDTDCSTTSTPSNTWTSAAHVYGGASYGTTGAMYALSVASGTNSIVTSCPGAGGTTTAVFEVSGITALDTTGSMSAATGGTCAITTSGSVTASTEYVIAVCNDWNNFNTWSVSSGYTIRNYGFVSGSAYTSVIADNDVRTGLSGTATATFTKSVTSAKMNGLILAFK